MPTCFMIALMAIGIGPAAAQTPNISALSPQAANSKSQRFIENDGQWDSAAHYLAQSNGLNMWLTDEGMVLDFHETQIRPGAQRGKHGYSAQDMSIQGDVVRIAFDRPGAMFTTGKTELPGKFNYFRGNDKNRWVSNVPSFATAEAATPYPGISMKYYFDGGSPRYDMIVAPGADPSQIGLRIDGGQGVQVLDNGNLRIQTSLGPVEEKGLLAYQQTPFGKVQVPCRMVASGNTVRFAAASYDRTKPLVIDPLIFSTYLGGSNQNGSDTPMSVALDSSGDPIVVGQTGSTDYPTTTGAYQRTFESYQDAFVSKLSADGSTLLFSTLLTGSSNSQEATAVAVDSSNEPVVAVWTFATDFPSTVGAYTTVNNGLQNTYVVKLNSTGTQLIYSARVIGDGTDNPNCIALDHSGNAYVGGYTEGEVLPTTAGVIGPTQIDSGQEGFLFKLSANGSQLLYGTYIEGVGGPNHTYSLGSTVQGVAVNSAGNAYVTGFTWDTDFPTTAGAYETTYPGSSVPGFVAEVSTTASSYVWATYLSGPNTGTTEGNGIALDQNNQPVVAGQTDSTGFPVTPGAFQTTLALETSGFITKFNATGTQLVSSTLLSGGDNDIIYSVGVDPDGNTVVAGEADSSDFPVTNDAYQAVAPAYSNGFVSKISGDAKSLLYSTFLGGSSSELIQSMALDSTGNPVVTGWTTSTDFPVSANAYQSTMKGNWTCFVSKLQITATQQIGLALNPTTVTGGTTSVGTVTLNPAAPAGGASVEILLNGANAATLPVTAGATQAAFNLNTVAVTANEVVQVGVSYAGATQTQNLTILAPVIKTVTAASAITGGVSSTGTVTLTGPAAVAETVALQSSNAALAVSASITIAQGASSQTFAITTSPVSSTTTVTITATMGSSSKTATVNVVTAAITNFYPSPTSIVGGLSPRAVIQLSGKAGPSGDKVTLSSNSAVVTIPASVTVPAGTTGFSFAFSTSAVSVSTSVTLTATLGSSVKTTTITVAPAPLSNFYAAATSVVGTVGTRCVVQISNPAGPSGDSVRVSSANTAAVQVPTTAKIPAGSTGYSFAITTSAVSANTNVTLTAVFGGVTKTITETVLVSPLANFYSSVSSIVGGQSLRAVVQLSYKAGPSGDVVSLSSSSTKLVVPASIKVAAGSTGISFAITTSAVTVATPVTLTAEIGTSTKTCTVTLEP